MSKTRFFSELIEGHKGVTAVIVPFNPETAWKKAAIDVAPRREGWLVKGTVNRVRFEGYIGLRWGRFFVLVPPELREKAKLSVGDSVTLVLEPTDSAKTAAIAREQAMVTTGRSRRTAVKKRR